jgi:hypothetical protein
LEGSYAHHYTTNASTSLGIGKIQVKTCHIASILLLVIPNPMQMLHKDANVTSSIVCGVMTKICTCSIEIKNFFLNIFHISILPWWWRYSTALQPVVTTVAWMFFFLSKGHVKTNPNATILRNVAVRRWLNGIRSPYKGLMEGFCSLLTLPSSTMWRPSVSDMQQQGNCFGRTHVALTN